MTRKKWWFIGTGCIVLLGLGIVLEPPIKSVVNKHKAVKKEQVRADYDRAEIFRLQANWGAAVESYKHVIARASKSSPYLIESEFKIGYISQYYMKNQELGKNYYLAVIEKKDLFPYDINVSHALFELGQIYSKEGNNIKASQMFEQLLAVSSMRLDYDRVALLLGKSYLRLDNKQMASKTFDRIRNKQRYPNLPYTKT